MIVMRKKVNLFIAILTLALITGATVVLATSAEDTKSLGLFDDVRDDFNLDRYVNHVNGVSEDTAKVTSKGTNLFIQNTIFTDHYVYAIIGLGGNEKQQDLELSGRIFNDNVDQTIYGLDGELQEIEQKNGVRYFFYRGKMAESGEPSTNKQFLKALGDQFLRRGSLREVEGTLLEFSVDLNGTEHLLATTVNNVFTTAQVFYPDTTQYAGDFYESVTLTPYELKLEGTSESLISADEDEWEQPHFVITIVRENNTNIDMRYDTRGSIVDEGFPVGLSRGHSSDTGEFYHFWDFREWELDIEEVSALIIDGETYKVEQK